MSLLKVVLFYFYLFLFHFFVGGGGEQSYSQDAFLPFFIFILLLFLWFVSDYFDFLLFTKVYKAQHRKIKPVTLTIVCIL